MSMNVWAECQELKASKSDFWLFCIFLGNAVLVIWRNAVLPGPSGDKSTLDRRAGDTIRCSCHHWNAIQNESREKEDQR